jgi:hypothetical protein
MENSFDLIIDLKSLITEKQNIEISLFNFENKDAKFLISD